MIGGGLDVGGGGGGTGTSDADKSMTSGLLEDKNSFLMAYKYDKDIE